MKPDKDELILSALASIEKMLKLIVRSMDQYEYEQEEERLSAAIKQLKEAADSE